MLCYAGGRPWYRGKVALPLPLRGSHRLRSRDGRFFLHATQVPLVRERSVLEAYVACRRAGRWVVTQGALIAQAPSESFTMGFGERTMGTRYRYLHSLVSLDHYSEADGEKAGIQRLGDRRKEHVACAMSLRAGLGAFQGTMQ